MLLRLFLLWFRLGFRLGFGLFGRWGWCWLCWRWGGGWIVGVCECDGCCDCECEDGGRGFCQAGGGGCGGSACLVWFSLFHIVGFVCS